MSQFDPVIGADKSGLAYRQDDNNGKKALLTHHKGDTAPSYAEAGTFWIDDSASPWVLKTYDETDWIVIGHINATSNIFTPFYNGAALQDGDESVKGLVERATDAEAEAGADTQRYITPAHLGAFGGGGLKLLSSQTASSDSSIEFTDLDSAYDDFCIVISDMVPTNSGVGFHLSLSTDNGSTYIAGSNSYGYATLQTNSASTSGVTNPLNENGTASTYLINNNISNHSERGLSAIIYVLNATASGSKTRIISLSICQAASSNIVGLDTRGVRTTAETNDAIKFAMDSGTIASGRIQLYGVRK